MENPIWSYFFSPIEEKKANIDLLKSLPVFEGLSSNELVQIERVLHERNYSRDEVIFNEGEPGAGMYIVKKGEIVISKKTAEEKELVLAKITERNFFGELALLDEIPRSATAKANVDTIIFGFSKPDLDSLLERNHRLGIKILRNLSRLICQRLLKANDNTEKLQFQLSLLQEHSLHE